MLKRQGNALLSALFIMTLVAIAATAMSLRVQLDIYRSRMVNNSDKLYLASQAPVFWAMELLDTTKNLNIADKQGLVAVFPKNLNKIYPNIRIQGKLYDLQARLNLNNLQNPKYFTNFKILLSKLLPNIQESERINIIEAAEQWIRPYQPGTSSDPLTSYYLQQKPAYYPSRQFFHSISELRSVRSVSASIYQSLEPYVTALPQLTPININSASKLMLMTLSGAISDTDADSIIEARGEKGFSDMAKIAELVKKYHIAADQISLESQYFLVVSEVSDAESALKSYVILQKIIDKQGKIQVSLLQQSLNTP